LRYELDGVAVDAHPESEAISEDQKDRFPVLDGFRSTKPQRVGPESIGDIEIDPIVPNIVYQIEPRGEVARLRSADGVDLRPVIVRRWPEPPGQQAEPDSGSQGEPDQAQPGGAAHVCDSFSTVQV